jgi:hypothetical protein
MLDFEATSALKIGETELEVARMQTLFCQADCQAGSHDPHSVASLIRRHQDNGHHVRTVRNARFAPVESEALERRDVLSRLVLLHVCCTWRSLIAMIDDRVSIDHDPRVAAAKERNMK